MSQDTISRRTLLTTVAAGVGSAMVTGNAGAQDDADDELVGYGRQLVSDLGERSPFEQPRRLVRGLRPSSNSKTPLQDLDGFITPSDLHYERHHSGVPLINPDDYSLSIEGLVETPMTFTLDELKKFPRRTEIRYLECGNNGMRGFAGAVPGMTPQEIDGMTSTSEWTGVALSSIFEAVQPTADATWMYVEGYDGEWTGSIPFSDRWNDSLIAWGQNGEAIRPEQGYPARLLLKGHPGGPNIKWIRRIEFKGDPIPEQVLKDFSSAFGSKSLITYPAYPNEIEEPGIVDITGLAWSGKGRIAHVDISTDGGENWIRADLQAPVLPQCHTRFRYRWTWDGNPALLMSRATDETGDVQPSQDEARAARAANKDIRHYNSNIRAWAIDADGVVTFANS